MLRRDRWWVREIERINRAHAEQTAQLVAALAHANGRPLPDSTPRPAAVPVKAEDDGSEALY